MNYRIEYTESARADLVQLSYTIRERYKAPITAVRYLNGIDIAIKQLSRNPEIYSIQTRKSLQAYGPFPRRLNYKRMAIIYNLMGKVVYIRRVIPANTISEL